jgi:transposase
LLQIVRRGKHSIRVRRALIIMASASGTAVLAIARLVAAHEDTVRDVIHAFNEQGLAALNPRWAGGRPRRISTDDEDYIVKTATTRPEKLGRPFTHWSVRKLAAYLAENTSYPVRIGRERLRLILREHEITFQRTRTWKESHDPDKDAKLDRIEEVTRRFPDRCFAFDQFGPLQIRPATAPAGPGANTQTGCRPSTTAPTASATSTAASRSPGATRCRYLRPTRSLSHLLRDEERGRTPARFTGRVVYRAGTGAVFIAVSASVEDEVDFSVDVIEVALAINDDAPPLGAQT